MRVQVPLLLRPVLQTSPQSDHRVRMKLKARVLTILPGGMTLFGRVGGSMRRSMVWLTAAHVSSCVYILVLKRSQALKRWLVESGTCLLLS